ncbi:hypothetical protein MINS_03890 [Mycolicibacterium insubricum]|uniref:Uncharacterized protein n=1 Tax=Mycolicibacterium insubricum TaxID=444597 RepID=A0A1X0D093_9MYCO|nr:hypothetical protein [Mycolicibacterium insubricum]MCV7082887.1 hypothetical protein [Mycolicibacterium insubricum]ORA65190.1 hypothetical protein BST26_19080 [Mycolicibacterium insubricum]BBZ64960.1 hypothetical protein MINS_03890 [Mycolicibacterium insubricum]
MNPLEAGAKQWLAGLTDDEFKAVVGEVREPADTGLTPEQVRESASKALAAGRDSYAKDHKIHVDTSREHVVGFNL